MSSHRQQTIIHATTSNNSQNVERVSRQRIQSAESNKTSESTITKQTVTLTSHQSIQPHQVLKRNIHNEHASITTGIFRKRYHSHNSVIENPFTTTTPITPVESRTTSPTTLHEPYFTPVEPLLPFSGTLLKKRHNSLERLTPVSPRAIGNAHTWSSNDKHVLSQLPPHTLMNTTTTAGRLGGPKKDEPSPGETLNKVTTPDRYSRHGQRLSIEASPSSFSTAGSSFISPLNSISSNNSSNGAFDKENVSTSPTPVRRTYWRGLLDHSMMDSGSTLEDIPIDSLEEYEDLQGQFFIVEDDFDDDDQVEIGSCLISRRENSPIKY